MAKTLSQIDLDALFGDSSPAENEVSALSQSDLDALFGDSAPQNETGSENTRIADILREPDPSQPVQAPAARGPGPSPGSENLSQDEIDALLKEFLG